MIDRDFASSPAFAAYPRAVARISRVLARADRYEALATGLREQAQDRGRTHQHWVLEDTQYRQRCANFRVTPDDAVLADLQQRIVSAKADVEHVARQLTEARRPPKTRS